MVNILFKQEIKSKVNYEELMLIMQKKDIKLTDRLEKIIALQVMLC